jgi:hypothetical protein
MLALTGSTAGQWTPNDGGPGCSPLRRSARIGRRRLLYGVDCDPWAAPPSLTPSSDCPPYSPGRRPPAEYRLRRADPWNPPERGPGDHPSDLGRSVTRTYHSRLPGPRNPTVMRQASIAKIRATLESRRLDKLFPVSYEGGPVLRVCGFGRHLAPQQWLRVGNPARYIVTLSTFRGVAKHS